jgi:hypothetical protein
MNNQAIIVLGMHRSGTSATTGMLRCLGVTLGNKLYAGHAGINAKGYFEHSNITNINEEALLAINSVWDDILPKPDYWWKCNELEKYANKIKGNLQKDFSQALIWAIKDPRVCRLIPWWLDILAEEGIDAKYLIVVRPPHDVYLSLNRRDGFSLEKSYLLWILHYLDAEFWTRKLPRVFVTFEDLVNETETTFKTIETILNLKFPISLREASPCLSQFISKDLIHHQGQMTSMDEQPVLTELARALHNYLVTAASNPKLELEFEKIDLIHLEIKKIQQSFSPLLTEQLRANYKIRSDLQLTMNKIFRSHSWVMGKPVRLLERWLSKDV